MKPWQRNLESALSAPDAPAAFDRDLLARFAYSARGVCVPARTLSHWLRGAIERGRVSKVIRGVYLNRFRSVAGTPADAAHFLRRDAVVSLNTVLGDAGVLNNPSLTTTAVIPMIAGGDAPRTGRIKTAVGWFHFFAMPLDILQAGSTKDNIDSDWHDHVRATPERALIDWLYLAASPYSKRTAPPVGDLDLDLLDRRRLARLAAATGVSLAPLQ